METSLGDEHGLFIVVLKGRGWFFSNGKKAVSYPVEVWIENIGLITFTSAEDFVFHD
ncbi:hypothetical protein KSP24_20225 [Paenibacillus sp. AK121]|uniref:hypothetical protein n=1 Tax=Paenibacillus TaxID=44249 RepID=UPI0014859A01|nr:MULTISPECIES: hypothetical protein [Paenibacillus]MBU9709233.1 hypothetical protein [Paenibacillus sp. AK121]